MEFYVKKSQKKDVLNTNHLFLRNLMLILYNVFSVRMITIRLMMALLLVTRMLN